MASSTVLRPGVMRPVHIAAAPSAHRSMPFVCSSSLLSQQQHQGMAITSLRFGLGQGMSCLVGPSRSRRSVATRAATATPNSGRKIALNQFTDKAWQATRAALKALFIVLLQQVYILIHIYDLARLLARLMVRLLARLLSKVLGRNLEAVVSDAMGLPTKRGDQFVSVEHLVQATDPRFVSTLLQAEGVCREKLEKVYVDDPDVVQAVSIQRGLRERYELHHGVRISDSALMEAALLSDRYIADPRLPDKVIDLIDEAAAKLKMEMTSKPEELDVIDRQVLQLEVERLLLLKASKMDRSAAYRLASLDANLTTLKQQQRSITEKWESERIEMMNVKAIKEEIERVNLEVQQAERDYDFNRAAELKHGTLVQLQKNLKQVEEAFARKAAGGDGSRLLKEEVTELDVAEIVSKWTGVGKTELTKALANILLITEESIVCIGMGEYIERPSVARLIGAPPGYVGYDEGGQLTEAVQRQPYSVILFDEVEKAHADVFNVLLQILNDGRVTDSQGRTVSFKNSIIILTSNLARV